MFGFIVFREVAEWLGQIYRGFYELRFRDLEKTVRILSIFIDSIRLKYSEMTKYILFYYNDKSLVHEICSIFY